MEGDRGIPVECWEETLGRGREMDPEEETHDLGANLEVALGEIPLDDTVERHQKEEARAGLVWAFRHSWASVLVLELA